MKVDSKAGWSPVAGVAWAASWCSGCRRTPEVEVRADETGAAEPLWPEVERDDRGAQGRSQGPEISCRWNVTPGSPNAHSLRRRSCVQRLANYAAHLFGSHRYERASRVMSLATVGHRDRSTARKVVPPYRVRNRHRHFIDQVEVDWDVECASAAPTTELKQHDPLDSTTQARRQERPHDDVHGPEHGGWRRSDKPSIALRLSHVVTPRLSIVVSSTVLPPGDYAPAFSFFASWHRATWETQLGTFHEDDVRPDTVSASDPRCAWGSWCGVYGGSLPDARAQVSDRSRCPRRLCRPCRSPIRTDTRRDHQTPQARPARTAARSTRHSMRGSATPVCAYADRSLNANGVGVGHASRVAVAVRTFLAVRCRATEPKGLEAG